MNPKLLFTLLLTFTYSLSFGQSKWNFKDSKYLYEVYTDTLPSVQSIHIYNSNHQEIQVIIPEEFIYDTWMDSSDVFILEDVNFDGHNDIRIVNVITPNLQTLYAYWFYDKQNGNFKSDTSLAKLWNVSFNPIEKTVHSWGRTPSDYGHALYKWKNNELELLLSEEEFWITDGTGYRLTTQVINGKTITKSQKIKRPRIDIYKHPSVSTLKKQ